MLRKALPLLIALPAIIGLALFVFLVAIRYPGNHGGSGLQIFSVYFGLVLIFPLTYWLVVRKLPVLALACCILGLSLSWLCDKMNIMVQYEEWIRRGMPEWGERQR